jgi:hypothetical protein
MTPIIVTNSSPAGRVSRVPAQPPLPPATPFFQDTFAGNQVNNANGFTWSAPTKEVVTFDGSSAMRFRFVGTPSPQETISEQRFNMGRQLQELWLDYEIYIPSNLVLRNYPGGSNPNKFLSLWPLNYSTVGDTYVVTEFWRDEADTTSFARMLSLGDLYPGQTIRGGNAIQNTNFISTARAGAWNRIRVHYKIASGAGQTDGIYEGWIGTELMWRSRSDWQFWSTGGQNYIQRGYLMGSSNPGYAEQTDYYIRDPKFYDQNPQWSDI